VKSRSRDSLARYLAGVKQKIEAANGGGETGQSTERAPDEVKCSISTQ
jgi:hypothetical protein